MVYEMPLFVEKALVFRPRQLTVLLPEGLPLGTEEPDSAILPAQEFQQAVDGWGF